MDPADYGGRARGDHDFDIIAVRRDRSVSGSTVTRAVSRYLGNSAVNLIQQWRNLRRIIGILIRERPCYDHAAVGIDSKVEFAPFATRFRPVFRLQPLTRSVDLRTGAVDQ